MCGFRLPRRADARRLCGCAFMHRKSLKFRDIRSHSGTQQRRGRKPALVIRA